MKYKPALAAAAIMAIGTAAISTSVPMGSAAASEATPILIAQYPNLRPQMDPNSGATTAPPMDYGNYGNANPAVNTNPGQDGLRGFEPGQPGMPMQPMQRMQPMPGQNMQYQDGVPPKYKKQKHHHSAVGEAVRAPGDATRAGVGATDRAAKTSVGLTDKAVKTTVGVPMKGVKEVFKALF